MFKAKNFLLLILLSSCQPFFSSSTSKDSFKVKSDNLSLVFSHNINGETHPCGCRTHPLGGLPQIAGKMSELKKDSHLFYIDTGDTLFDSPNIPKSIQTSKSYNAKELAKQLKALGLSLWVPGDQDFALGVDFLKEVIKEADLPVIISNLKDPNYLPHRTSAIVETPHLRLFILGMIHPNVFQGNRDLKRVFKYPKQWIELAVKELQKKGYDSKDKSHRLILLSHAGLNEDKKIAREFPHFDWIIGAHSMSFLRNTVDIGKTKITQTLSRNHYLGELKFNKKNFDLKIHEVRDEDQELLKPNPLKTFIASHLEEMKKRQEKEQEALSLQSSHSSPIMTAKQCLDCHGDQTKHWSKTPHALSYITLIKANEETNLGCVECHSVGLNQPGGFFKAKDIVKGLSKEKHQKYWNEVKDAFGKSDSIRSLSPGELMKMARRWQGIDQKYEVSHNYANVQCLNCHDLHRDHPFQKKSAKESMTKKCLSCHTKDQSPEWYVKLPNGLPGEVDQEQLKEHLKAVACPKREDE